MTYSRAVHASSVVKTVFIVLLLTLIFLFLVILIFCDYKKKNIVTGYIDVGNQAAVMSNYTGVISKIYKKKGDDVNVFDTLFKLKLVKNEITYKSTSNIKNDEIKNTIIEEQINSLKNSEKNLQSAFDSEIKIYEEQKRIKLSALSALQKKIADAEQKVNSIRSLVDDGFISKNEQRNNISTLNDLQLELDKTSSDIKILADTIIQKKHQFSEEKMKLMREENRIKSERIDYENGAASNSADEILVYSNFKGVLGTVFYNVGDIYTANKLYANITREERNKNNIRIHLHIPSSSNFENSLNDLIFVRVDAFPYESYGGISAKIVETIQDPTEVETSEGKKYYFKMILEPVSYGKIPVERILGKMTVKAYLTEPPQKIYEWLFMPIKKSLIRNTAPLQ